MIFGYDGQRGGAPSQTAPRFDVALPPSAVGYLAVGDAYGRGLRRVVGSTLAAETKSLLNGLGHARMGLPHTFTLLKHVSPDFDVAQRSAVLRHFRLQCIVEDKRCGFDLVIARQCMQRLGATIRWASTNRQLSDALTKDLPDLVDLFRSCMRSGEYQLSPEHIILERAAAERTRRKQRQVFSQSSCSTRDPF